jgi:mannose-6-phosphate isomerase
MSDLNPSPINTALRLAPEYRDYVWGGNRLRPDIVPTAEAWVVYEHDRITSGPLAGSTLREASAEYGPALLGKQAFARTGTRFPLLIKLLDCAAWLSLQVHPNDEQAMRMEGPDKFGKTEAWHFIEAASGSEILCGLQPGTSAEELAHAVRRGSLLEHMQRFIVQTGDSIFIRAGMIHALGPGLLVYEVQQTSDLTYRVFDWDRPANTDRQLHIEKSIAVADPAITGKMIPCQALADGGIQALVSCPYFTLQLLVGQHKLFQMATGGESFHALTVIAGGAIVDGDGWRQEMDRFDTVVVPAACGAYRILPQGDMQILKSSVEPV